MGAWVAQEDDPGEVEAARGAGAHSVQSAVPHLYAGGWSGSAAPEVEGGHSVLCPQRGHCWAIFDRGGRRNKQKGEVCADWDGPDAGDKEPSEAAEPEEEDPSPADWEEEEDQPRASDEEAKRLNDKVKDEMADAMKGVAVQNVTMAEVMESRSAREVIRAISLIFVKYRSLGIPLYRMHCDRAKEFLARPVQQWCLEHNLLLTMTAGDDHAANGRVETEVNQVKRRLRVVLKDSGAQVKLWPTALRHVVLQRNQMQLQRLGVDTFPMLPFYSKVMVKTKRWHKKGPLASPFREVRLLGPSPMMS